MRVQSLAGVVILISLVLSPALGEAQDVSGSSVPTESAPFDLQLSFDVTAASGGGPNLGAEFDGTFFYTTRPLSNLIHKYDTTGQLVEAFSIPGVTGLKDLAFDGIYMYGGDAGTGNVIYQMDFTAHTLVSTIPLVQYPVRSIAYDPESDGFWVGDLGTPLYLFSRNGTLLNTIFLSGLGFVHGTAYDGWTAGGPYLWAFDRAAGQGAPQSIHQIHLPSESQTGFSHNVGADFPNVDNEAAGGLFTAEGIAPGTASIGGVLQGSPNMFFVYELVTFPPQPPTLSSPPNGATDQPTTVTLDWNVSQGATSYQVQVSTNASFTQIIEDVGGLTADAYVVSGLANDTQHWWRVRATNVGGTSNWLTVWNFRTIVAAPPPPVLAAPPNGATDQPTTVTLDWNTSSRAESYQVQLSLDPLFTQVLIDMGGVTGTSYIASNLTNGRQYWWRVRATNAGGTSNWSTVWDFTTSVMPPPPPPPPLLVRPLDGATNQPTTVTLAWEFAPGAVSYQVQVSTNPTFTSIIDDSSSLGDTTYVLSGLQNETTYWWRVNATNAGGPSNWSTVWSFTTSALPPQPPEAPTLISPVDEDTTQATTLTLTWNSAPGAEFYMAQVSTDPLFTQIIVDVGGLVDTTYLVRSLANSTTYWWRVNSSNATGGTSAWSTVWSFRTVMAPPPPPILVSPSDGAVDVPTMVTLGWNQSAGAISYRAEVSTDSSFLTTVFSVGGLTGTSQIVGGLANNTVYWWRVNASNLAGPGNWSTVWSFTTIVAPPSVPILVSPVNGSTGQPTSLTLDWNAVVAATSYHVQVSTDSSFVLVVADTSGLTGTSHIVGGLANSVTYWWRVRAGNVGGTGNWSIPWSFSTSATPPSPPPAPILGSPLDGDTTQPTTVTLAWNPSAGAESYQVQLSTDALFAQLLVDTMGLTSTTQIVAGLENRRTYWWRVNASNTLGGTSEWSTVWSFTTVPALPEPPVLFSPADGAVDQPTTLTLDWNPSTGAVSYHIQVSGDTSFVQTIISVGGITGTSHIVSGLENSTTYWWRVSASNPAGTGNWSNIRSFATSVVIGIPPPDTTNAGAETAVSLIIPSGIQSSAESLFYRRAGETIYSSTPMTRNMDSIIGVVPGSFVTLRGVEFYVKVTILGGQDIFVNTSGNPGVIRVLVGMIPSPLTHERVSYKMVSVPLSLDIAGVKDVLDDDFGEYDSRLWRLFRWEGGAYQEYTQIDSSFSPGTSFWLISHEGKSFDVDGGLSVNSDNPFPITLQPGWNQIASPFAFRSMWDTTGLPAVSLPFIFDGSEYTLPTSVLEPWEGYFVENAGSVPLTVLVQPREVSPMLAKEFNSPGAQSDLEIRFSSFLEGSNLMDTHNYVGILNGAGDGSDQFDWPEPPPVEESLRLSILEGEKRYMRNTKPPTDDGHFWDMSLSCPRAGTVDIGITQVGKLPDGFSLYLLDKDRFRMIPHDGNSFSIVIEKSTDLRTLRVIIGTPGYAAGNSGGIPLVPLEYRLEQNFPNPFNPETTIRYQLRERTHVLLELFNILGQRVKTLVSEEQVTGMYSAVWKGDNDAGNLVGSGVYLCRLTARDFVATRKLLLIR